MARIRKNDQVMVTTGKDRGKVGRVIQVIKKGQRVIVEKVNLVKKTRTPHAEKSPRGYCRKGIERPRI